MFKLVCGLEQRKKLEAVPLSNDVLSSRIVDIFFNILKNVTQEFAASPFPFRMQLDETTHISQCSQLLVFVVCYVHDDTIKEESLCLFWKLQKLSTFWKWLKGSCQTKL
jgi:hypothetical protein